MFSAGRGTTVYSIRSVRAPTTKRKPIRTQPDRADYWKNERTYFNELPRTRLAVYASCKAVHSASSNTREPAFRLD